MCRCTMVRRAGPPYSTGGRALEKGDDISFHSRRVLDELDLAVRAASTAAAEAHFSLSALHLDRIHKLAKAPPASR